MRARHSTFSFLVTIATVSLACSSSDGGGASSDAGSDTATGTDTNVPTDSGPAGDAKTDAKADTKPGSDTGTDSAIEGFDCDPIAQTGCTAPKSKCTAITDGADGVLAGCVEPGGTAAVDTSCTRKSEDSAGIGNDSCAPGAYCSSLGTYTTPPTRNCRKFCSSDSDCGGAKKCSALIPDPAGSAGYGLCVPTCTVLGTDCTAGMDCSVLVADTDGINLYGTCRAVGTVAEGGACTAAPECAANMVCSDPKSTGSSTCNALCDGTHTCPGGKTCTTGGGLPTGVGVCG